MLVNSMFREVHFSNKVVLHRHKILHLILIRAKLSVHKIKVVIYVFLFTPCSTKNYSTRTLHKDILSTDGAPFRPDPTIFIFFL